MDRSESLGTSGPDREGNFVRISRLACRCQSVLTSDPNPPIESFGSMILGGNLFFWQIKMDLLAVAEGIARGQMQLPGGNEMRTYPLDD